jgi:hypothetical protein
LDPDYSEKRILVLENCKALNEVDDFMVNESSLGLAAAAEAYLREELKDGALRRHFFPMLSGFGIRDYSDTVRSFTLNYLTAIGRRVPGLTAISEYPVFPNSKFNARDYREVKLGSVWFEKINNRPLLVAEFERYEDIPGKSKSFREKLEDLLIGFHQLGGLPKIVLFVYWTYPGTNITRVDKLAKILEQGFSQSNTSLVSGVTEETRVLVYYCPAAVVREKVTLNHWVAVR